MLDQLSPQSRIWIFQSTRKLSEFEQDFIRQKMDEFIPQWAAHGDSLFGGYDVREFHFLIVAVDESKAMASGCSVDTLMHKVQEIGKELEIDFMNRLMIAYEADGEIQLAPMEEFKALIRSGTVDGNTTVFNNLVPTKAEFDQAWKTTVANSWHKNLLQIV